MGRGIWCKLRPWPRYGSRGDATNMRSVSVMHNPRSGRQADACCAGAEQHLGRRLDRRAGGQDFVAQSDMPGLYRLGSGYLERPADVAGTGTAAHVLAAPRRFDPNLRVDRDRRARAASDAPGDEFRLVEAVPLHSRWWWNGTGTRTVSRPSQLRPTRSIPGVMVQRDNCGRRA